jgi:tetratricopeptide (TPR) repeat protein
MNLPQTNPSAAAPTLANAGALHRAGRLDAAEHVYRALLAHDAHSVGALTGLGACLAQKGDNDAAAAILRRAIAASTTPAAAAPALANLANVLQGLGRLDDALLALQQAQNGMPGNIALTVNLGNLLRHLERYAEALACYDEVLAQLPDHAPARLGRGIVHNAAGRLDQALDDFTIAVEAAPQDALTHYNRGVVLQAQDRLDDAAAAFEACLARNAAHADAWLNLGIVRKALGQRDAASRAVDRALELRADWPEALASRGHLLQELDDIPGALACYDRALEIEPENAGVLLTRGEVLRKLLRCDAAIASYKQGLALDPNHPDAPGAHLNVAICHLLLGQLLPGWQAFEWRWGDTAIQPPHAYPLDRLWIGAQDPGGRTLLLHHEQGYGDTLQFCRYVPLLARRGAQVILEVPVALHPLLRSLPGVAQLRTAGDPPMPFDLHTPLLSLPLAFRTTLDDVPSEVPYLAANPEVAQAWRHRLGTAGLPRIGLAWSGNPAHGNDANRSLALRALQILVTSPAGHRCEWVSLQRELRDDDEAVLRQLSIRHFGPLLADLGQTAGLVENVDLVISVDTSIAHLAGALGRPLWILLPHAPDWRWMLERGDTPWYPQARLFRQHRAKDWSAVIGAVERALEEFLAGFA